ncbi:MAG TPA: hypothetical protein VFJ94_10840 [Intrasporangium sp.]|uniref:hypothetical protein n=1 Tax=Intrasporangium sp. TaxID=1925024 RepID=UPI002D76F783|nr:hypothetical protein [Intrasporangium sp.]HET7399007.1 hypothetical protein [Intrasporangium sp.]
MPIHGHAAGLFTGLVDDAAVFPPGLAPLDRAVREHLDNRDGPYAACVGTLLVPHTAAAELAGLAARDERTAGAPMRVAIVARPGTPLEPVAAAFGALDGRPGVEVVSAELGWHPGWRAALDLGVPLVLEVGTGADQRRALDDLAHAGPGRVRAKFRTGATPTWPRPDEATLAEFVVGAVRRGRPFKLTGGLHHATRDDDQATPQHGLLNVLLATHEAIEGAASREVAGVLRQTSAELLVDRVTGLAPEQARRIRASFTAYGCCGVLDPLRELAALGLLD